MKCDVSFHLLHGLVNVAVQYRHRTKAFHVRKRLLAVFGSPTPLRVDRPEWNVRENYDWRAGLELGDVFLQPFQLVGPQTTQAASLEVQHIYQADEMGA